MASCSQSAELCSKIDRSFVPAHGRISHPPIRMQQQAPGVCRQTGKSAVQHYTSCCRMLSHVSGVGIYHCFVEHGIYKVQAELAAIQGKFFLYNVQPLLWFGPALYSETRIDAEM